MLFRSSAPQAELSLLSHARKSITIPIVAIGGITQEFAPLILKEGADMLAVIQGIFAQTNIFNATRQLVDIIDSTKAPS